MVLKKLKSEIDTTTNCLTSISKQHGGVGADLSKTLAKVTQYRQTTVPKLAKT